MFRIAFIIGLILTAFSLSVTASPLPQQPAGKKKVDDNYIKSAKQIIGRYDTNGDEKLSKQEWQKMLLNPAKADANQDQQITVDEYARWARSKDRSRKSKEVKPTQIKPTTALESPAQKKQIKPQPKVESKNEAEVRRLRAQRLQAENQKNQERARQAEGKNGQDQREQELIEQIERQLEQRDRREMEQRERREVEQRERREMEQREGREVEERARREMEQRERREMEQNRRREMEHHATHGEKEDWEHEFRKLEEARTLLHREQEEAARKFGDDHPRRRTIQKELDEIEGVMKQMFRERGEHVARHENREHENREHHEHDDHGRDDHESHQHEHDGHEDHGDHERHDHLDRDHEREMPIEERLELLRVAFDHLNDAGMHDLAEETKRRGEELERQLRERNAHGSDQIHRLIEESHRAIHAVNQRLDQVQRELQEMRDQFNRLRNQR